MADTRFYKFLEAAFRYKLFKSRDAVSFSSPPYNLPYEGSKGIFDYARKALPAFYVASFPDTKEGHLQMAASVIQKLDRKLDPTLQKYFDPSSTPQGYEQTPAGEPAAAMAPSVQVPKIPSGFTSRFKSFGSGSGRFFQRNVGKFLTLDRAVTGFTTILGGIIGKGLAGNPGALAGAGIGALTPSFVRANGTKVLGRLGNRVIDAGARFSSELSNRSLFLKSSSKKLAWALIGAFLLLVVFTGLLGGIGGSPPPGEAAPIPLPGGGTQPSDCPIPNGVISCGSQFTPINGCGHCGIGYPARATTAYCSYPGTKFALDIASQPSQRVILPKVNGSVIQWVWMREEISGSSAIQAYAGTQVATGKKYYLQLHHTQPGSGNAGGMSGEAGGVICASGCDHVHVQIGDGGSSQTNTSWLDAGQYFCRRT